MRAFVIASLLLLFPLVLNAQGEREQQIRDKYENYIRMKEPYLHQCEKELRSLEELRSQGVYDQETYLKLRTTWEKERDRIQEEIEGYRKKMQAELEQARQEEQQKEAQKEQAERQQRAQRERERAIRREQEKRAEEERRKEEERRRAEEERRRRERQRRIEEEYERNYQREMRESNSTYDQFRSGASRLSSKENLNGLERQVEQSRVRVSLEDVPETSPGVEVTKSTAADRMRKRLAGMDGSPIGPKANPDLVHDYWARLDKSKEPSADAPFAYTEWLYGQFKELSGYDIKEILGQVSRTEEERQALLNFNMFSTGLLRNKESELDRELSSIDSTQERKVADMAILSAIPYGTNDELLDYTDYKLVDSNSAPAEVQDLAKMIELCNNDTYGFHAQLFYNDKTHSYTISYEGTSDLDITNLVGEFKDYLISKGEAFVGIDFDAKEIIKNEKYSAAFKDWILTNAKQGLYGVPDQFKLVGSIAAMVNKLPDTTDVQLTGHSLGGGLAAFCGLLTGRETTTFNAEGVNWNIIWEGGKEARRRAVTGANITAYHDRKDLLTKAQDYTPLANALGKEVIVDVNPEYKDKLMDKLTGHMIVPMAKHFIHQENEPMERWRHIAEIKKQYKESLMELSKSSLAAQ